MKISQQIAKHFKEVYFGTNWTWSNMQQVLNDISYEEAITKLAGMNHILGLSYHIHYYVQVQSQYLAGNGFNAKDELSFLHPNITNEAEWKLYLEKMWQEATVFVTQLEQLDDAILDQDFIEAKYGHYYRNLNGLIEHTHYHLGQIACIKNMIRHQANS